MQRFGGTVTEIQKHSNCLWFNSAAVWWTAKKQTHRIKKNRKNKQAGPINAVFSWLYRFEGGQLHGERKGGGLALDREFTVTSAPLQRRIIKDLMELLMNALLSAFYVRPPLSARKILITLETLSMRLEQRKHYTVQSGPSAGVFVCGGRGGVRRSFFSKRTAFISNKVPYSLLQEQNKSSPNDFQTTLTCMLTRSASSTAW